MTAEKHRIFRNLLIAVFIVVGLYLNVRNMAFVPPHIEGRNSGLDEAGKRLLDIPNATERLTEMMKQVPADQPLLIIGPAGSWMSADLANLAGSILLPRTVESWSVGDNALAQKPGAILFYHANPPPGLKAEPLGDSASLVIVNRP